MILLDYSPLVIANTIRAIRSGQMRGMDIDKALVRSLVFQKILFYKQRFGNKYGEFIVCCDNKYYWRKRDFEYYKRKRKEARAKSDIDWDVVHQTSDMIRQEIKDNFPYRVLDVPGAEADDVIAILAKHYSDQEQILIISEDKDMLQLQRFENVKQYAPRKQKFLKVSDPELFLKAQLLQGDSDDGVPNFLSDADSLATPGKRQTALRMVKLEKWINEDIETIAAGDPKLIENYKRNELLIDFRNIPAQVELDILEAFETSKTDHENVFDYFAKHKLRSLTTSLQDFLR